MKYLIFRSLQNQKGFSSLLIAFGVVTIAALTILQLSTVFQSAHEMRARRNQLEELKTTMRALLGQKLKQAYVMGKLDSTCRSHGSQFKKQKVNGQILCIDSNSGLCVVSGIETGNKKKFCISTKKDDLNWKKYSGTPKLASPSKIQPLSEVTRGAGEKRTQFLIPDPSAPDNYKWLSCDAVGSVCFRMVLCHEGEQSCSLEKALGVQVVRLGPLPTPP